MLVEAVELAQEEHGPAPLDPAPEQGLSAVYNPGGRLAGGSTARGIWHLVLRGPPRFPLARFATKCGWRYGLAPSARLAPDAEVPRASWTELCGRCYPEARQSGKDSAALLWQTGESA